MTTLDSTVDYDVLIPNNVALASDARVRRGLERWHPGYIDWWMDMGPDGFQTSDVYLRTAVRVESKGADKWAVFDYVKMPDYRWGILLAPQDPDRKIPFGRHVGEPAWQEVPGEYRAMLRRLIVIQGDTEPASVEQQRFLGKTAPSLYDMRNLFQVNVEEGRHLWAMVYLLQKYFGRDGREEAGELLRRRSGSDDAPRMLGAFNEETPDWLSFFLFTFFTDRDGRMQLESLAQSGFDPLSRTCRFMLTEEAFHMFVGETGVTRIVQQHPALNALNARLRDDFTGDCSLGVGRWNKTIRQAGTDFEITLPHVAFHRRIGVYRDLHATPAGEIVPEDEWTRRRHEWLPDDSDRAFIESLMKPEFRPGHYASWIAEPRIRINHKPGDFEWVKLAEA